MTISLKHAFQSAKGDGTDSTLVRPSNWNAEHTITLAADKLIGRATAGTGAAEEIPCTSLARQILAATDTATILAALGIGAATTGDVKLTLKTAADSGWLIFDDGTFGNVGSGASQRQNADTQNLFNLLFANINDTNAPLLTSAGAGTTRAAQTNAATAWAANCRMSLPKALGRALAIAGSGSGLTARVLGATVGNETVALAIGELPQHNHGVFLNDPGHAHSYTAGGSSLVTGYTSGGLGPPGAVGGASTTGSNTTGISVRSAAAGGGTANQTADTGSGTAHNNMQPSSFLNAMVKL